MDEWWILDGVLCKNPSIEKIRSTSKTAKTRLEISTNDDTVIETWYVGNPSENLLIDFGYSLSELNIISDDIIIANFENGCYTALQLLRKEHFKKHNVDPDSCRWLRRVVMPKSWFAPDGVYLHGYA